MDTYEFTLKGVSKDTYDFFANESEKRGLIWEGGLE